MRGREPSDEHELPAIAPPQQRKASERVVSVPCMRDLRRGVLAGTLTGRRSTGVQPAIDRPELLGPSIRPPSTNARRRRPTAVRCAAWMPAEMRARFGAARVARLATVRPDGRPHLVPCCFALVGNAIYSAVDAKPKSTLALQRLANIRARPAVTLLVDHYADDWRELWWVRGRRSGDGVDAAAPVRSRRTERAVAALQAKYRQYRARPAGRPGGARSPTESWQGWSYDDCGLEQEDAPHEVPAARTDGVARAASCASAR